MLSSIRTRTGKWALVLFGAFPVSGLANETTLTASPAAIELGKSATLSWTSTGRAAFLSGVGAVPATGSVAIRPEASTTYVLISEDTDGIQSASVTMKVEGGRNAGLFVFPDPADFPVGLYGQRTDMRYVEFLDLVFKTLQDNLQFKVRGEHLQKDPFYIFFTDRKQRVDLVKITDKGIRTRRLSYAVRVNQPTADNAVIAFHVKAIVEYQRKGESKWHPETSPQVVDAALTDLKNRLESQPKEPK